MKLRKKFVKACNFLSFLIKSVRFLKVFDVFFAKICKNLTKFAKNLRFWLKNLSRGRAVW
ncbi:MAG TPA: hypothetical protein DDW84_08540 [Phycisphaerales bacterium]|nr:hypothetical protein [Phycisphaerales bacterium]